VEAIYAMHQQQLLVLLTQTGKLTSSQGNQKYMQSKSLQILPNHRGKTKEI
jgi:hypothetical protein